ncbi:serine hydrolase domain-containing protein [Chloroflexota bacterium]
MKTNYKKIKHYFAWVAFIGVLISLIICSVACNQPTYSYQIPEQIDDQWVTAYLGDVGISEEQITDSMISLLKVDNNPLHSIIIVKDGKLVLEEYFSGEDLSIDGGLHFEQKDFDRNTLHSLASASKSITSILLGIAIDQGKVQSTQEKLFPFFPEYSDISDAAKDNITLRHLLTMSSGIPWDESYPYDDPRNDLTQMLLYSTDPMGYVLEKSVVAVPGESFIYNSGTTNILGEVIRRSTGLTLSYYANQYLFTPMGITSYDWVTFPNAPEIAVASSLLYLQPRDMAKIGQMYLQKGVWNGKRIVSESWILESTKKSITVPPSEEVISGFNTSYGYQWWRGTFSKGNIDTYYAAGFGGQFIFILPDIEIVIVFTAGQFEGGYDGFVRIVNDHILPAIKGLT